MSHARGARRVGQLAVLAALVLLMLVSGCRAEPPGGDEAVEGPASPADQLDAVQKAVADAETRGDWVHAEAALEVLIALEPEREVAARRVQLRHIRRHRRIASGLDEVAELLEAGAWRAAESWLATLEASGGLDAREQARVEELRELARILSDEERDERALPPTP